MSKRICILGTGSEIVTGEITNTNGQAMCQQLFALGANIGEHVVVDDIESNLVDAIQFLMPRCDSLIITGGLGPTKDDRTRFALAKALGVELSLDETSWTKVQTRAKDRGFTLTPNNKQQAYFPKGATVYPNPNGSADAGLIEHNQKAFFILPGPPSECLPLFEDCLIPYFEENGYLSEDRQYKWHIRGIGESDIAYKLEHLADRYSLEIAYRCSQPDLFIKLQLTPDHAIEEILSDFDAILAEYLIKKEFPK